jgi:hypothetical protein
MEKEETRRWTPATMYPIIQRLTDSGLSQAAFARQEGLPQMVLSYWLRKYREAQEDTMPGFLAVTPPCGTSPGLRDAGSIFARLLLPDGAELHFHQSVPSAYLREVLGW